MKKREIFGAWLGMGLLAVLLLYPTYQNWRNKMAKIKNNQ